MAKFGLFKADTGSRKPRDLGHARPAEQPQRSRRTRKGVPPGFMD